MQNKTILLVYAIVLASLSFITFIVYGVDKKKAIDHAWRIKESVLLLLGFFSGLGGLLGMLTFRHKTAGEHWYFYLVNILGLILHASALIYIAFFLKI